MYKLTIEFKTNQELADFVIGLGGISSNVKVEEKKPEVKAKKKEAEPAPAPVEVPKAAPAPVEPPPAPAIDRAKAIAKAVEIVQDLNKTIDGPTLAQHLSDLYIEAGCPIGLKISQLSDEHLTKFMPLFLKKAEAIKSQAGSFI